MLKKPICIVGAARSGTSLLGLLLSRHPDIAFWNEPKYLWRYRNPTVPHDKRSRNEATSQVKNYIRSHLKNYVNEQEAIRLVEKTPSNCFRVPFVHAVLPEVRFVHLIRDGRDAAFSAWEQWKLINDEDVGPEEEGSTRRLLKNAWSRLRTGNVPLVDLPFYGLQFGRSLLSNVGLESRSTDVNLWGPEFPGIRDVTRRHDLLEICAIQWKKSVRAAEHGLRSVPDDQQYELRFREVVQNPRGVMHAIFDFADLSTCEETVRRAEDKVNPEAADRWRNRDPDKIQRIMDVAGDLVQELEASRMRT